MDESKMGLPAAVDRRVRHEAPRDVGVMDPVQPGQYWTYEVAEESRSGLVPGRAYLVQDVKLLDGEAHTVVLRRHPLEARENYPTDSRQLLASEFYGTFSRVDDGAALRQREIAEIHGEVDAIQAELREGPPGLPGNGRTLLQIARHVETAEPDVGTMITNIDKIDAMQAAAARQVEMAEASAKWMTERTQAMGRSLNVLGDYHAEMAAAQVAAVSKVVKHAKRLEEGVQTLGLYTGEGVTATLLVDGEPAARDAGPLHLYQRRLYMDEEYLVHVHDEGADVDDFVDFASDLARDPALIERILPMERSIVAMRIRRTGMVYVEGGGQAAAIANAVANQPNLETFLLIRDGGRIWKVESELGTHDIPRLFPTRGEADKPFRGWGGEHVTIDDVRYTDKLAESDKVALMYRRLLILLWGLNDRLQVFGTLAPAGTNFLSLDFQTQAFRFIHDDEDGLPNNMPPFDKWAAEKNRMLQSGSRVLCLWDVLVNPATAPGLERAADYDRHTHRRNITPLGKATNKHDLVIARKKGASIVVDCEANRGYFGDGATFNATVDLTAWDTADSQKWRDDRRHDRIGYLVLDGVTPEEIDFYLNSRGERAGYLSYVPLFFAVRDHLRTEREQAAPFVRQLEADLRAAGILTEQTREGVEEAVQEAVRMWRAANRGRPVPEPGSEQWPAAMKAIYDVVWRLTHDAEAAVARVADAVRAAGLEPLRVVSTGRGKLAVYTEAPADEQPVVLAGWPWVHRWQVSAKTGALEGRPEWAHLAPRGDEKVLHDWPAATRWASMVLPYERAAAAHFERAVGLVDAAGAGNPWLEVACGRPPRDKVLLDMAREVNAWMRKHSGEEVVTPRLLIPLALVERYLPEREVQDWRTREMVLRAEESKGVDLVMLHADPAELLSAVAPGHLRREVVNILVGVYLHKSGHRKRLLGDTVGGFTFRPAPYVSRVSMRHWVGAGFPSGLCRYFDKVGYDCPTSKPFAGGDLMLHLTENVNARWLKESHRAMRIVYEPADRSLAALAEDLSAAWCREAAPAPVETPLEEDQAEDTPAPPAP